MAIKEYFLNELIPIFHAWSLKCTSVVKMYTKRKTKIWVYVPSMSEDCRGLHFCQARFFSPSFQKNFCTQPQWLTGMRKPPLPYPHHKYDKAKPFILSHPLNPSSTVGAHPSRSFFLSSQKLTEFFTFLKC